MDKDDLIIETNQLRTSLGGLEIFTDDRFTTANEITIEDLNALHGLIASVEALANQHFKHVESMMDKVTDDTLINK